MKPSTQIFLATMAAISSSGALACASCGCSLSADWESQGLSSSTGARFDLRYDYLDQNQIRSGTHRVDNWPIAPHEEELYTKNQYLTASLDYSFNPSWGINVAVPYMVRSHATNGFNYDGTDAGTSKTSSMGDIKVVGRYQGFSDEHNTGLQFGLKLPTGSYTETFSGGAIAGAPLDRGLQPGTGTTDLILGVFHFAPISQNWDYFTQAAVQLPLDSRADYRPGQALNFNLGFRYLGFGKVVPQIQVNARVSAKDSGLNASPDDSGGKTIYLSPGVTIPVTSKVKLYGFVQLPIYQNFNGYQLAPKYTASVGARFEF